MRCISSRSRHGRRRQVVLLVSLLCLDSQRSSAAEPTPNAAIRPAAAVEDAAPSEVRVAWGDLARLVANHPQLAAARYEVEADRRGVASAEAVPNPSLEGSIDRGVPRGEGTSRVEWGLSLTMPLGWLARRDSRVGAAQAGVGLAVAQVNALQREVLLRLRTLFWQVAHEQARVESLEVLSEQTRALVDAVASRVARGELRPIEATRIELEFDKVEGERDAARAARDARRAELALWIGVPPGKTLVVVSNLKPLPSVPDGDSLLLAARRTHPAMGVAKAETRVLEAELGAERAGRMPEIAVTGFTSHELDRRAYGVGLSVDLPLFDWKSSQIAGAEARLAAGRKRAEAVDLEIQAAVLDAQASCRASIASAGRLENSVVPRTERAASTMERTYELGEASLIDVIDARRTLIEAHRLYLDALAQAQIDCSRLRTLLGEDIQ